MKITLEDGRVFDVGIAHTWTKIPRYPGINVRSTKMWCKGPRASTRDKPINIEVSATCSPEDQFSKRTGRMLAREKFLQLFYSKEWIDQPSGNKAMIAYAPIEEFTRTDRREIYKVIMPEYHVGETKKPKSNLKITVPDIPMQQFTADEWKLMKKLAKRMEKKLQNKALT